MNRPTEIVDYTLVIVFHDLRTHRGDREEDTRDRGHQAYGNSTRLRSCFVLLATWSIATCKSIMRHTTAQKDFLFCASQTKITSQLALLEKDSTEHAQNEEA